jgi:hypothetical protein
MIRRLIFVTGLALLCFSIVTGGFLLWLFLSPKPAFEILPLPQPGQGVRCHIGCGSGGGPGGVTIRERSPSTLAIVGELPKQMDSSTSDTIQVKLTISSSEAPKLNSYSIKDRTILLPDISKSLYPDVGNYCNLYFSSSDQEYSDCLSSRPKVKDLFGPGYELFASAHLVATNFDVQLLDATEQPADQYIIEWDWNIFPKSSGNQSINLDVDLHWKPEGNNGKADIFRQLWGSNFTITVNPPPFITSGQLTISSAVSAFFGLIFAGVSGPMMLGELKKGREAKRQNREQASRESLEQALDRERARREFLERELDQERAHRKLLDRKRSREKRLRREQSRYR